MNGKSIVMIGIVATFMFITPTLVHGSDKGVEGNWQGTCDELDIRVAFKVWRDADGALVATGDSPDQEAYGIQVDEVIFEAGQLRLRVDSVQGIFEGKLNEDGSTIEGKWHQHGNVRTLVLNRIDETQTEALVQGDGETVQALKQQPQNSASNRNHPTTGFILVLVMVGLIGLVVFFIIKLITR